MNGIKKALSLVLALVMVLGLGVCAVAAEGDEGKIVILHTNDVHCGIDRAEKDGVITALGYSGLAAVKTETEAAYGRENVILVDCGDSIQGQAIGTLTHGAALVELMNRLGYAVAAPGNHEFDWGVDNFTERAAQAEYTYLCCNLTDLEGNPLFDAYQVVELCGVKVGFVGIDTPETFFKSTPTFFQDSEGNYIYTFSEGNEGQDLYRAVQKAVDAARAEGAEYVVALAHLGIEGSTAEWTSSAVIANTTGIDVMLDGHSHEAFTREVGFTGAWMFPLTNPDANLISDAADEAMHWMVMNGVLRGDGNGNLNPQSIATRAEAAQILLNFSKVELSSDTLADAA